MFEKLDDVLWAVHWRDELRAGTPPECSVLAGRPLLDQDMRVAIELGGEKAR